jgi:hypothetical protein
VAVKTSSNTVALAAVCPDIVHRLINIGHVGRTLGTNSIDHAQVLRVIVCAVATVKTALAAQEARLGTVLLIGAESCHICTGSIEDDLDVMV